MKHNLIGAPVHPGLDTDAWVSAAGRLSVSRAVPYLAPSLNFDPLRPRTSLARAVERKPTFDNRTLRTG